MYQQKNFNSSKFRQVFISKVNYQQLKRLHWKACITVPQKIQEFELPEWVIAEHSAFQNFS